MTSDDKKRLESEIEEDEKRKYKLTNLFQEPYFLPSSGMAVILMHVTGCLTLGVRSYMFKTVLRVWGFALLGYELFATHILVIESDPWFDFSEHLFVHLLYWSFILASACVRISCWGKDEKVGAFLEGFQKIGLQNDYAMRPRAQKWIHGAYAATAGLFLLWLAGFAPPLFGLCQLPLWRTMDFWYLKRGEDGHASLTEWHSSWVRLAGLVISIGTLSTFFLLQNILCMGLREAQALFQEEWDGTVKTRAETVRLARIWAQIQQLVDQYNSDWNYALLVAQCWVTLAPSMVFFMLWRTPINQPMYILWLYLMVLTLYLMFRGPIMANDQQDALDQKAREALDHCIRNPQEARESGIDYKALKNVNLMFRDFRESVQAGGMFTFGHATPLTMWSIVFFLSIGSLPFPDTQAGHMDIVANYTYMR